jgi:hypothetical protein
LSKELAVPQEFSAEGKEKELAILFLAASYHL